MGDPTKVHHLFPNLGLVLSPERLDELEAEARADADQLRREREREVMVRRAERLERASACGLRDDVRQGLVSGEGLDDTHALRAVREWDGRAATRTPCLVLAGGTGCGKTVAAAWLLARHGGVWIRAERLVRVFSANFGDQFEEQEKILGCGWLTIDDVGSETDPVRMMSALTELLEQRQDRAHTTVITTNLTVDQATARYPEPRLRSRLRTVQWVKCADADLRRAP